MLGLTWQDVFALWAGLGTIFGFFLTWMQNYGPRARAKMAQEMEQKPEQSMEAQLHEIKEQVAEVESTVTRLKDQEIRTAQDVTDIRIKMEKHIEFTNGRLTQILVKLEQMKNLATQRHNQKTNDNS